MWRSFRVITCFVTVLACHHDSGDSSAATPSDFGLIFGSGGGITGRWQGYTVGADGSLMRWEGTMAGENETPAGKLSAAQRAELWREIQDAKFFDVHQDERGNMTRRISVTANQKTHHAYWPMGSSSAPVESFERLYETCLRLAAR